MSHRSQHKPIYFPDRIPSVQESLARIAVAFERIAPVAPAAEDGSKFYGPDCLERDGSLGGHCVLMLEHRGSHIDRHGTAFATTGRGPDCLERNVAGSPCSLRPDHHGAHFTREGKSFS